MQTEHRLLHYRSFSESHRLKNRRCCIFEIAFRFDETLKRYAPLRASDKFSAMASGSLQLA
jgi:hypothetical protein